MRSSSGRPQGFCATRAPPHESRCIEAASRFRATRNFGPPPGQAQHSFVVTQMASTVPSLGTMPELVGGRVAWTGRIPSCCPMVVWCDEKSMVLMLWCTACSLRGVRMWRRLTLVSCLQRQSMQICNQFQCNGKENMGLTVARKIVREEMPGLMFH